jgi:ArsR family transcriptional regulator, arsenate/arsenite/antimonite-responsive transcriptional repressor / arsenate reductase (thioredoxin)
MRSVETRARIHAALAVPARLEIVDAVTLGDRTVGELGRITGVPSNLLAHHLDVLDDVGLISRRRSEGDRRRRYVALLQASGFPVSSPPVIGGTPLFVCTHNSARSQFAAALWSVRTGREALSAGTHPAARVHPMAVTVAAEHGVDLSGATPTGYDDVAGIPDVVISVCDRAAEAALPRPGLDRIHWSIADPVLVGTPQAFRVAFAEITERIDRLAVP